MIEATGIISWWEDIKQNVSFQFLVDFIGKIAHTEAFSKWMFLIFVHLIIASLNE